MLTAKVSQNSHKFMPYPSYTYNDRRLYTMSIEVLSALSDVHSSTTSKSNASDAWNDLSTHQIDRRIDTGLALCKTDESLCVATANMPLNILIRLL